MKPFPYYLREFWAFTCKQAWACLFGGLLLVGIFVSKAVWSSQWWLSRYDALFFFALLIQILFIRFKLETRDELYVILIFHVVGTVMELFKTSMGSWTYPEENFIRIMGVPLFSGFMYSAVGSYISRITRIFNMHYPPPWACLLLCALIYTNFFTHHFWWDIRWGLFALTAVLYGRTWVYFQPGHTHRKMPLLLGFILVSFFIWLAENVATLGNIWLYPSQVEGWHMVSLAKMGSWFLLMIISAVLVTLVHPPEKHMEPLP